MTENPKAKSPGLVVDSQCALKPWQIGAHLSRWWHRQPSWARWVTLAVLAAILGLGIYQKWHGEDTTLPLFLLGWLIFASLMVAVVDATSAALDWLWAQVGQDVVSVIKWLLKAILWLVVGGVVVMVAVVGVSYLPVPLAIVVGAIIIASAIWRASGRGPRDD